MCGWTTRMCGLIAVGLVCLSAAPVKAQGLNDPIDDLGNNSALGNRMGQSSTVDVEVIDWDLDAWTITVEALFAPEGDLKALVKDGGIGTRVDWKTPLGASPDGGLIFYGLAGFQHQTWGTERVNVNTPRDNFLPSGDFNAFGGELGFGVEADLGMVAFSPESPVAFEFFTFGEAAVGAGGCTLNLQRADFNPQFPIVPVGELNAREAAGFVNGRVNVGIGLGGPRGNTLSLVGGYQFFGTDLVFDDWSETHSVSVGVQGSWFFARGLPDVEPTLTVTDTQEYGGPIRNVLGNAMEAITDTSAFRTLTP